MLFIVRLGPYSDGEETPATKQELSSLNRKKPPGQPGSGISTSYYNYLTYKKHSIIPLHELDFLLLLLALCRLFFIGNITFKTAYYTFLDCLIATQLLTHMANTIHWTMTISNKIEIIQEVLLD